KGQAASHQDRGTAPAGGDELGQQPRPAHAGLARNQDGTAAALGGAIERTAQVVHLCGSADDLGAGLASGHRPSLPHFSRWARGTASIQTRPALRSLEPLWGPGTNPVDEPWIPRISFPTSSLPWC